MDIISTQDLHQSFFDKYSIGASQANRFASAFLSAFNSALMDLFNWGAITEPDLIKSLETDSTLEIKYLPIIKTGVKHFLQEEGEWIKGDARDSYSELNWRRRLSEAADMNTRLNPWGK